MSYKLKLLFVFYYQAADYVSECGIFGDGDHKVVKTLQVSCWLNGAACCLKLNNFRGAIKLCSKVKREMRSNRYTFKISMQQTACEFS